MRPSVGIFGLIVLLILGGTYSSLRQSAALDELGVAIRILENKAMTQTLETTWNDADGVAHTVSTPRLEGEKAEDWGARHQEGVAALQAIYPPA